MIRFLLTQRTRRTGVAGLLVVLGLLMTACTARGGGSLGDPLPGAVDIVPTSDATFGFNFTCEERNGKPIIRGQVEYHDHGITTVDGLVFTEVDLHGEVDAVVFGEGVPQPATCEAVASIPAANFSGVYRPQTMDPFVPDTMEQGRFQVFVFDQGEPGRTSGTTTGDAFTIELTGGTYGFYTRSGDIEGGNIQID
jgi:hypothetical protein